MLLWVSWFRASDGPGDPSYEYASVTLLKFADDFSLRTSCQAGEDRAANVGADKANGSVAHQEVGPADVVAAVVVDVVRGMIRCVVSGSHDSDERVIATRNNSYPGRMPIESWIRFVFACHEGVTGTIGNFG